MRFCTPVILAIAFNTLCLADTPASLDSRIIQVSLFKNGLAVVKREVRLPGSGTFEVTNVPQAVHGTFWVESDLPVVTRVTTREVALPESASNGNLQHSLAGRTVIIRFREPAWPAVTGTVVEFAPPPPQSNWDRRYTSNYNYRRYDAYPSWGEMPVTSAEALERFLTLETAAGGRTLVDLSTVATMDIDGPSRPVTRQQAIMQFTVGAADHAPARTSDRPGIVHVSYLAKGLTWLPAYRLDLSDSSSMQLAQQAVIRNELEDFTDTEITLISGFPHIEFANVNSPLTASSGLAEFFRQLSGASMGVGRMDNLIGQQAVAYNDPGEAGIDFSAVPRGDGVDLHFQSIGRHSMKAGDSLMLSVAHGSGPFERIVEWIIPDTRNEFGMAIDDYRRQQNPEEYDESVWDSVQFRNPLEFAMTTAPAMIVEAGRFNGQSISKWANVGEQALVRITRALSMRTGASEVEEEADREFVELGGWKYQRSVVRGTLTVCNHRQQAVTMSIQRRFSGDLLEAEGEPRVTFREEGVFSVNRRNQLNWAIILQPGEERILNYRYKVLVRH